MTEIKNLRKSGIFFTIPDFDSFTNLLHDRLDGILYYIEDLPRIDTPSFMLITNFYDRDPIRIAERQDAQEKAEDTGTEGADIEALVYGGTESQRKILEQKEPVYYVQERNGKWDIEAWKQERDPNWKALENRVMTRGMKGAETFDVFDEFRDGKVSLEGITIGTLKNYFAEDSDKNVLKENEKPIISDCFDIERDEYIGIPLLGAGRFQGVVWIIFKQEYHDLFANREVIKRIIKTFALAYNDLLISWEVSNKTAVFDNAIKEISKTNPIQNECRVEEYLRIQNRYHRNRIEKNAQVLSEIRNQYIRTATISILLDSFAHNISAHSLTALSWWFRERSEYLGEGRKTLEALGRDLNPLIRHYKMRQDDKQQMVNAIRQVLETMDGKDTEGCKEELLSVLNEWDDTFEPDKNERKRRQRPTLSRELFPLFKFLLEKGAFWSGIARQTNFAGKVSSLYNVLWHDFVNNPLYLGTIANTEEILKLHLRITVYEQERPSPSGSVFRNIKKIKTVDGVGLDGVFATINLLDFKMAEDARSSMFVEKGPLYTEMSRVLEQIKVFFPGGVIGKHAFFTLLENEIRNVKHFHGEDLKFIQKNGLTLAISIHERPFDSQNPVLGEQSQLLKFGVWLHHPVELTAARLVNRIKNLDSDIIDEKTFRPRLGGNFQDKICASMLLTSTFNRVQDNVSVVGDIYYPWIKTAGCPVPSPEKKVREFEEFEVSHRKYRTLNEVEFADEYAPVVGPSYLKKYFHLWKGADILSIDPDHTAMNPADVENQGRYRFLHLQNADEQTYKEYKAKGIVRLLGGPKAPASISDAYRQWLDKWMKKEDGNQDLLVIFREENTKIGRLSILNGEAVFENADTLSQNDRTEKYKTVFARIPAAQHLGMQIAHGSQLNKSPEKLNYRTDGELIRHFCQGVKLGDAVIEDKEQLYELIETFAARICVFDHRVYNRLYSGDSSLQGYADVQITEDKLEVQRKRLDAYRQHLLLDVRNETEDSWQVVQTTGFLKYHFLIVHLSFMESLKDINGNEYREERIIDFINDQILKGRPASEVGDDFTLIITTGRGREKWWETIKENPEYARFTTFRPIESILGAIEDAMQVADDFNLKYNLVKLLFGS